MRTRSIVTAAFALSLTASGCDPIPSAPTADEALTQSDWIAETINGKPVLNPGRVTLSVVEDRVSGRSGCNLYSGSVEYGRGTIKVGPLISTKMACTGEGLMQQESTYLDALQNAQTYNFDASGRLAITTPAGGILVYTSAPRQKRPE